MRRLAALDKALVLILVPLWVVCFALGVSTQVRGGGAAMLGLTVENAESYPVLTGEYSSTGYRSDPIAQAGLRSGDRLIRLRDADLRGVGTLGLLARTLEDPPRDLRVAVVYERDGERHPTSLVLARLSVFRPLLAVSFSLAASALFLLLRGRPTPTVRAYFYYAMCQAVILGPFTGSRVGFYPWFGMFVAVNTLTNPLLLRLAFLFPDDRAPEDRWHRIWPWFFGINGLFALLMFTDRMAIAEAGFTVIGALGAIAALAVVTRKYHHADRVARRQMKWVLLGSYCAGFPVVVAGALNALDPRFGWLWFASFWAAPLLPLSLLVSVVRFNLFDIDRLLSATASYNVLLVLLGAAALTVVPRLAEAVSDFAGVDPWTGQMVLSLALAAVVVPAHRRLRPQIDRVFFKERYALDHGIAELLPTLSACTDTRQLTERAGAGLDRLLLPEACVVYAVAEQSYVPVFVRGRAVPPAFAADSPLIGTLRGRRTPLSLSAFGRRPDEAPLGPFDRAALETLGAEVVVPVRHGDALAAFICLGPKRSGDVYTSTDLSHLTVVAEKMSTELRRFDQDETVRDAREMQESLRRYVPGAIAEQLSSGTELASGERELAVLFVDIRGYTSFSESRGAEEIFSTVNRYTETVSELVRKHGGAVVEFNGDGMMAVFGAPRELAHKERAAVEAGRAIVEAVAALPVDDGRGGKTQLSVGVGIATGEAFVGNIRAVDRMIWTAIGNTPNLAARLQTLTRDLDAALVIDGTTWERAGAAAADFEKKADVPIRGRRERQDVYALSLRLPLASHAS